MLNICKVHVCCLHILYSAISQKSTVLFNRITGWLYKQLGKTHTGLNLSSARYQLMLLGNTYCDEQLATASSLLI